ncbi:MAG: alpha/beta hydrolase [Salinarimonas sp.]|nr:alpha/beta hydrolase [Salinarimonas sp.]
MMSIMMMGEPGDAAPAQVRALDASARRITTICDGKRIVWREWGSGAPLVLLHGGHGSWLHWLRNIDTLAQRYRVIAPDMPSYGDSDALAREAGLEDYARPLRAGIREIAGSAPVTLCGFSFGGVVAGQIARLAGDEIERVVFAGTGGLALTRPPMAEMVRWRDLAPPALFQAHRRNLEILMIADPANVDDTAIWIQAHNAARTRGLSRPISMGPSLARNLPHLTRPLAFIWGENDATAKGYLRERRDLVAHVAPGAGFSIVAGAGHWLQYEDPSGFEEALIRHLSAS